VTDTTELREKVARIIDPEAWLYFDRPGEKTTADILRFDTWKQSSLRKADSLLALPELAAVPALREALTELLNGHEIAGTWRTEQAAIDKARAALALAEGRER
jgi:hypothetical protein